jgi:hypothetical protein
MHAAAWRVTRTFTPLGLPQGREGETLRAAATRALVAAALLLPSVITALVGCSKLVCKEGGGGVGGGRAPAARGEKWVSRCGPSAAACRHQNRRHPCPGNHSNNECGSCGPTGVVQCAAPGPAQLSRAAASQGSVAAGCPRRARGFRHVSKGAVHSVCIIRGGAVLGSAQNNSAPARPRAGGWQQGGRSTAGMLLRRRPWPCPWRLLSMQTGWGCQLVINPCLRRARTPGRARVQGPGRAGGPRASRTPPAPARPPAATGGGRRPPGPGQVITTPGWCPHQRTRCHRRSGCACGSVG